LVFGLSILLTIFLLDFVQTEHSIWKQWGNMTEEPKVTSLSKEQILKKAIEKAVKNGWWRDWHERQLKPEDIKLFDEGYEAFPILVGQVAFCCQEKILFDHDFAKAFFGEKVICHGIMPEGLDGPLVELPSQPAWKIHLQSMVLEKNPVKYLEKFLDEKD
tara:strand:+ start:300 stop:779 length:480 start_codon:yes stop_codon:yes gene_type:complete